MLNKERHIVFGFEWMSDYVHDLFTQFDSIFQRIEEKNDTNSKRFQKRKFNFVFTFFFLFCRRRFRS